MIIENLSITEQEEDILKSLIGKKIKRISMTNPDEFDLVAVEPVQIDFGDKCYEVTRNEVVINYFSIKEDAGYPMIRESIFQKSDFVKNINRAILDVLIVNETFEFTDYKITYPKAFIFQFEDCNLITEKNWLISIVEISAKLEPHEAENFGLTDEMQFWYDPEVSEKKPLATQEVKSLKLNKIISSVQI